MKHPDRLMCYVAGPYINPDPVWNTHKTIMVAEELEATEIITAYVPHLSLLWHIVAPHDAQFWYDYDLAILARCDCLLRIPGQSTGADDEVAFAIERRIPVFYEMDKMIAWVREYGTADKN